MLLQKICIQYFKSIINTWWIHLSQDDLITILAWQNESWKTSLLRALRFFEEWAYDWFEENDRRLELSPRVDCTFKINSEEYENLSNLTNKKIADYINKYWFNILRWDTEKDNFNFRYSNPEEFNKLVLEFNNEQKILLWKWEPHYIFEPLKYFNEIRPKMVFYSSFTESILPSKITLNELGKNEAVKDFEIVYDIDFKMLLDYNTSDQKREREVERIRKEAADNLNSYWKQKIAWESAKYKFTISVKPQESNPWAGYINFFINQWDKPQLSISQKSQWFQWFIWFNLRLKAHEKLIDKNWLILLIDEPWQWLHEVAQNDVKTVLEELASKSKIQIIYSTHQPTLLWKTDIEFSRLLLVERTNKAWTKFKTITQLIDSKWSLDSLSPIRTALWMVWVINPFWNNKPSLVVEWMCEYFYIKTILQDQVSIIPSTWVDQVPNIFSILNWWWIQAKVMVDDDAQWKWAYSKIKKTFFDLESTESTIDKKVLKSNWKKGIEDFLSKNVISQILEEFWKSYNDTLSKTENADQIWKLIFAKIFYDKYSENNSLLDEETVWNFTIIKDFIEK